MTETQAKHYQAALATAGLLKHHMPQLLKTLLVRQWSQQIRAMLRT